MPKLTSRSRGKLLNIIFYDNRSQKRRQSTIIFVQKPLKIFARVNRQGMFLKSGNGKNEYFVLLHFAKTKPNVIFFFFKICILFYAYKMFSKL